MTGTSANIVTIRNPSASLTVDLYGGAITGFHLPGSINPLTFKLSSGDMPENNRSGAAYQGHFACIGRWGPPSAGEIKAGLPHHGQPANLLWSLQPSAHKTSISMQVTAPLEGLQVDRSMCLDDDSAVFLTEEKVTNLNALGRLFNMVQHPTLAKPFLSDRTIVNCNADQGFNYKLNIKPLEHAAGWPYGITENGDKLNISRPDKPYSSVFSFTIKKDAKFGWLTAYSPENKLLIGYLWKRNDYAWISLWQDFDGGHIRYRGLEFGTTGMHKLYQDVIKEGNHQVFGEANYQYLDAGESQTRSYLGFMCETQADYTETGNVYLTAERLTIEEAGRKQKITIKTSLKL